MFIRYLNVLKLFPIHVKVIEMVNIEQLRRKIAEILKYGFNFLITIEGTFSLHRHIFKD